MSKRLCRWKGCTNGPRGGRNDLGGLRRDALYCNEACSKAHRREKAEKRASRPQSPDKARTGKRRDTAYIVARVLKRNRQGEPVELRVKDKVAANKREKALSDSGVDPATHIALPARDLGIRNGA